MTRETADQILEGLRGASRQIMEIAEIARRNLDEGESGKIATACGRILACMYDEVLADLVEKFPGIDEAR